MIFTRGYILGDMQMRSALHPATIATCLVEHDTELTVAALVVSR
jgi:hypothetical protein